MGQNEGARPGGPRPTVSVVIPHFNDLAGLDKCLSAVEAQTYPSELVQVIVADNASPQGLARVQEAAAGRAKVVLVEERGAGPARNGGVAHATGEILAFTDSDCVPEPQWLEEGIQALQRYDFVGGAMRVLAPDARLSPEEAFELVFAFDNQDYVERKGFTVTANLFCPRETFHRVGDFRTRVSEDYDWSQRARQMGLSIGYAAEAMVGHPARKDWPELKRKWLRMNQETFELLAQGVGGKARWAVKSLALPISAVVHTPKVLGSPKLRGREQRLAALTVLYRLRSWRAWDGLRLLVGAQRG